MGSKTKIMEFVLTGVNEVYKGGPICDLFAGSASLAGAIGHQVPIISNDIQNYSKVLARAYLCSWRSDASPTTDQILAEATAIVAENRIGLRAIHDYSTDVSLEDFQLIEDQEREIIDLEFERPWHLFLRYYSGTWWSAEQALWIDALRETAEKYKSDPTYDLILASIMYAMAYASQGTGHYAQYRVANTPSSMKDILIYRRRSVPDLFARKHKSVFADLATEHSEFGHKIMAVDYVDCLKSLDGGTVYADPPYAFVHYSRFYHAIETLVLYDYPELQIKGGKLVKGRYREGRHQSPFCIRTQVSSAFQELFRGVRDAGANLVLSYSNSGMISLEDLGKLAEKEFAGRSIEVLSTDYKHMTLGRQFDRDREVEECLMLVK
ncbi:DNA adenine methylase [Aurantiacibacter hainanensis]|uniref:DNA adenine methylase n=1 Tax=Aurantiacibacter hainanensis TaxID=3076114 RepID=UPI0030C6FCEB